jgi:transcriptional regulator with XRE-family HTH domain
MTTDDGIARWPLSDAAARQINKLRRRAGLNREQLAIRCRKLGAPRNFTAAAIANIETGRRVDGKRRRDVTVDELAIFARALNVSPVVLLFELDEVTVTEAEVLPDLVVPMWTATAWFTGEGQLPSEDLHGQSEADSAEWVRKTAPVTLFREHDRLVQAMPTGSVIGDTEDEVAEEMRKNAEERRALVADLRRVRESMRMVGLRPPALTKRLAEIVEEGSQDV